MKETAGYADRIVNNGSMGHGSVGQMGQFFGWVIWVMGRCIFTHDPPA